MLGLFLASANRQHHRAIAGRMLVLPTVGAAFLFAAMAPSPAFAQDARPTTRSGKTQVLAKIDKREITVNELRIEMRRLGVTEPSIELQRLAMQSIINRHLLVEAAKKANFHRKPDAVLQMRAASNQALADLFLGSATQAAEPTLDEIEDYITDNPGLFVDRTRYEFLVLSLPSTGLDIDRHTPLFSETADFAALKAVLDQEQTAYAEKPLVQASSSFAREIRDQLSVYGINDNIVIKAKDETQIMKIRAAERAPLPSDEWRPIARRLVMEQNALNRARSLLDSLKLGNSVTYFRADLAPPAPSTPTSPTKTLTPAPTRTTGK